MSMEFLCCLCRKTDIEFTYFGLESVMVFAGTTECTNVFVVSIPSKKRKKKRLICEFEMDCKRPLCWRSNVSHWWHNFIEAKSENGCGKWHFLVRNRVRIWRTGWYTPTKNSQEYPPPLGSTYTRRLIEFEKTLICLHWWGFKRTVARLSSSISW